MQSDSLFCDAAKQILVFHLNEWYHMNVHLLDTVVFAGRIGSADILWRKNDSKNQRV